MPGETAAAARKCCSGTRTHCGDGKLTSWRVSCGAITTYLPCRKLVCQLRHTTPRLYQVLQHHDVLPGLLVCGPLPGC